MNHGQNRGSKSRKLSQEKCSLNENIGKFRNFAEIGRAEFRTYVEIWGSICKMHHWLRKLDALYIPRYIHAYNAYILYATFRMPIYMYRLPTKGNVRGNVLVKNVRQGKLSPSPASQLCYTP